ncbi:MAG: PilN domain-containing protein [Gemmatimonadetes bacterium]|nr:PilN domain-containing protein [Gemmatimonadota bacterium]
MLASLTDALPDAAWATAVRVRGDSVFMDGVADEASPVFDAIARASGIAGVRATAPVRRESIEGDLPLEHFSIGARLATTDAARDQASPAARVPARATRGTP